MAIGPSSLALRLQACLRVVLCWGPGPPGPCCACKSLRLGLWLGLGLVRDRVQPQGHNRTGHECSARGGNAASKGGVLAARALPCLGFPALLWPVVLVVVEALLPLLPVPLVEVLVMHVEVLVPPVVLVGEALH